MSGPLRLPFLAPEPWRVAVVGPTGRYARNQVAGMIEAGTPLVGGIAADKWLGTRKAVAFGALLLVAGHFTMGIEGKPAVQTLQVGGAKYEFVSTGRMEGRSRRNTWPRRAFGQKFGRYCEPCGEQQGQAGRGAKHAKAEAGSQHGRQTPEQYRAVRWVGEQNRIIKEGQRGMRGKKHEVRAEQREQRCSEITRRR